MPIPAKAASAIGGFTYLRNIFKRTASSAARQSFAASFNVAKMFGKTTEKTVEAAAHKLPLKLDTQIFTNPKTYFENLLDSPITQGVVRGNIKTANVASKTAQAGIGITAGIVQGVGKEIAAPAEAALNYAGKVAKHGITFDEEHGIYASDWLVKDIGLAVGAGALVTTLATSKKGIEDSYDRDPEDPTIDRYNHPENYHNHPELHKNALGAHGSMVTEGSRNARKRY